MLPKKLQLVPICQKRLNNLFFTQLHPLGGFILAKMVFFRISLPIDQVFFGKSSFLALPANLIPLIRNNRRHISFNCKITKNPSSVEILAYPRAEYIRPSLRKIKMLPNIIFIAGRIGN